MPQFAPKRPAPDPLAIDALRVRAGWTIEDMAYHLEISEKSAANFCSGRNKCPAPTFRLLSLLVEKLTHGPPGATTDAISPVLPQVSTSPETR